MVEVEISMTLETSGADDGEDEGSSDVKSAELLGSNAELDTIVEEPSGAEGVALLGPGTVVEGGDEDGRRGLLELDKGGGGGELAGEAVDVGAGGVLCGTADVGDNTALSAVGRRRTIVVAAGTRDRYVVEPRVEVSGSAVLPTMGSQALAPMGCPSCWMTVGSVFR
jgi:hypothetical protein